MTTKSPGRNDPCRCGSGRTYEACCLDADRRAERAGIRILPASEPIDAFGDDDVWQADLVPVPASRDDGPDARPAVALVVCGGAPTWIEAHRRPGGEIDDVADLLAEALTSTAKERGRWPDRVEVRHAPVVAALVERLGAHEVDFVTRPQLNALDVIAEAMVAEEDRDVDLLGQGRPCSSFPRTWVAWGLPEETVAELFAAAAAYYRERPWEELADDALLFVETPPGRVWGAAVLGGAGIERGLSLYSHPADRERILTVPFLEPSMASLFEGYALCIALEPVDEIPRPMRREVLASGWEIAAPDAYPTLLTINAPGGGVSRADARALTVALRAVATGAGNLARADVEGTAAEWRDPKSGTLLRLEVARPVRRAGRVAARVGEADAEPGAPTEPSGTVHRVTITLDGIEPKIWRTVEVPSEMPLRDLHEVVQGAMGWEGYHLYLFEIDGVGYGEPDEDGWMNFQDPGVAIGAVAKDRGSRLRYLYDFGDDWVHELVVDAVVDADPVIPYPRCLDGARACPPEDCGGVDGYHEMLEALGRAASEAWEGADGFGEGDSPDAREVRGWLTWAMGYDPEHFSVDVANRRLEGMSGGPVLEPRVAVRCDALAQTLSSLAVQEDLPSDLIDTATDMLYDYAAADPRSFMAAKKPEILAAGALHAASMTTFMPRGSWQPTVGELAARFGVSEASVGSRSLAIRERASSPGSFDLIVEHAAARVAAILASGSDEELFGGNLEAGVDAETFADLFEAVGFRPPRAPFEPAVLMKLAGLGADDVSGLERALRRGIDLDRARRGRTERDVRPLRDQLRDDDAFGAGVRAVFRDDDVTPAARDALARWIVGRLPFCATLVIEPMPTSSLLALSHLAGQGALRGDALADASVLAAEEAPDAAQELKAGEVRPLVKALGTDDGLDPGERVELLCDLVRNHVWAADGRLGPELVSLIADEEAIPVEIRYDTLGHLSGLFDRSPDTMLEGPATRRRALLRRLRLESEPASLIEPLLDADADEEVRGRAAAELLEELGVSLAHPEVERLVRLGLAHARASVRQAFFRTGLALLGDDARQWMPEGQSPPSRDAGGENEGQLRLL